MHVHGDWHGGSPEPIRMKLSNTLRARNGELTAFDSGDAAPLAPVQYRNIPLTNKLEPLNTKWQKMQSQRLSDFSRK
jgi:hypothetical protein